MKNFLQNLMIKTMPLYAIYNGERRVIKEEANLILLFKVFC